MYIFFCLSIVILIIGIVSFVVGKKKEKQNLETLLEQKKNYLDSQIATETKRQEQLQLDIKQLTIERSHIVQTREIEAERLEETRKQRAQLLLDAKSQVDSEVELLKKSKLQQLESEYKAKQEFLEEEFVNKYTLLNKEIDDCQTKLNEFKAKQQAIVEAIRRQKEIEEQEVFYSIQIPITDQEDMTILQSMDIRLHNRDVIPKLIWELFIRRPTQEMIKRVTGGRKVGGIYKITYKKTGEAYIGKTTDFSTRWQNHIKTVIGLEGAARATLHNRMAKDGLWNYTFEILEEVDKDQLSTREAYYIDFYGAKNQLNMKSGDTNGTQ